MTKILADITNPAINTRVGGSVDAGKNSFQTYLSNFITLGFAIGTAVFLFMLIIGGINYITAGGDKEAVARATKRITNALIGIIVLFSTYMIIRLVGFLFGINVLNFNLPVIT